MPRQLALHGLNFDLDLVAHSVRERHDETLDASDAVALLCDILNFYVILLPSVNRCNPVIISKHVLTSIGRCGSMDR